MSCASAAARVPSATASASNSASSRAAWPPVLPAGPGPVAVVVRVGGGDLRHPRDAPAQLGGGVHQDVRRHPARPPLHRVGPDPVVHRQHRGGGPLVVVAQRPPPPGQAPRARQEQLEQDAGRQVVARHRPAHQGEEHPVGLGRRRRPHMRLQVAQRPRPHGVQHLAQLRPGGRVVGQVHRPLGLEQPEHVGHGPDHPDRWPPTSPRPRRPRTVGLSRCGPHLSRTWTGTSPRPPGEVPGDLPAAGSPGRGPGVATVRAGDTGPTAEVGGVNLGPERPAGPGLARRASLGSDRSPERAHGPDQAVGASFPAPRRPCGASCDHGHDHPGRRPHRAARRPGRRRAGRTPRRRDERLPAPVRHGPAPGRRRAGRAAARRGGGGSSSPPWRRGSPCAC